jgi:hypothetical protein
MASIPPSACSKLGFKSNSWVRLTSSGYISVNEIHFLPSDGSSPGRCTEMAHRVPTNPPWKVRETVCGITGRGKVIWMNCGRPCHAEAARKSMTESVHVAPELPAAKSSKSPGYCRPEISCRPLLTTSSSHWPHVQSRFLAQGQRLTDRMEMSGVNRVPVSEPLAGVPEAME